MGLVLLYILIYKQLVRCSGKFNPPKEYFCGGLITMSFQLHLSNIYILLDSYSHEAHEDLYVFSRSFQQAIRDLL